MKARGRSSPLRVVLVDDSPRFRAMLERVLGADPRVIIVGWASSGREAIELVGQLHSDLVLMDLAMPGINGIEATRAIKTNSAAPQVVMLTLHDTAQHREAAAAAGVDHFICKTDLRTHLSPVLDLLLRKKEDHREVSTKDNKTIPDNPCNDPGADGSVAAPCGDRS